MKKLAAVFLLLFLGTSAFAKGGLMAGADQTKVIQTKWFDIIYPEESRKSANRIAAICDELYEKLCKEYSSPQLEKEGIGQPQFRMKVVITPFTDVYNALYSNYTFNHIILFDTPPEENSATDSAALENTFTHELTHAVSFNTTKPQFRRLMNVYGDSINPGGLISTTTFISEGATVARESKDGEGRLNDGFYLHTIRQAKACGRFPDYSDVTGSRDIYPSKGEAYSFGGPFAEYLQKTYGMEKYAEFWAEAINSFHFSYRGVFEKCYGFTMDKAWKDFIDQIQIPEVKQSVLEEEGVTDFLEATDSPVKNFHGHIFTNIRICETGIYFLDESTYSVWFSKKENGSFKKPEKLFTKISLKTLNASRDGKFLALSFYDINHAAPKTKSVIYNVKKNSFYNIGETGLRDAAVIQSGDKYYAAAVKTFSQDISIYLYELNEKGKSTFIKSIPLGNNQAAYSLCDGGKGKLAFILKEGLTWNVAFIDDIANSSGISARISMPSPDIRIRNLASSPEEGTLTFSYAQKDTFPRYGRITLNEDSSAKIALAASDINGGIYSPVDAGNGTTVYGSRDIYYINLMEIKNDSVACTEYLQTVETFQPETSISIPENTDSIKNQFEEKNYSSPYNLRGLLLPISVLTPMTIENDGRFCRMAAQPQGFVGLTYAMNNPWESDSLLVSAGWDMFNYIGGAGITFSGNANTSVYNYGNTSSIFFSTDCFLQCTNQFAFSSGFRVGNYSSFVISEQNNFFYGKIYKLNNSSLFNKPEILFSNPHWYDENIVTAQFSTIHKTGSGTFESAGIALSANYQTVVCGTKDSDGESLYDENLDPDYLFREKKFYHNLYPEVIIKLPKLIPVECAYGWTYNLPVTALADVVPDYSTLFLAQVSTVLLGKEIQRGASFMPLFLNRFYLSSGFIHKTKNDNRSFEILHVADDFRKFSSYDYSQAVFAELSLEFTYNSGMACNLVHHLSSIFMYKIQDRNFSFSFNYSLGL